MIDMRIKPPRELGLVGRPCPFCGSTNLTIAFPFTYSQMSHDQYIVKCCQCHVCGPIHVDKRVAVDKWNERQRVRKTAVYYEIKDGTS